MQPSSLQNEVASYPVFEDFPPELIEEILQASSLRRIAPGEVLIRPGEPNDQLYLLIKGQLQIVLENNGTEIAYPIPPGSCLGEMSIVMEQPASAMAVGQKPSLLLCIPESVFWDRIMSTRRGFRNIMSLMARRLERANHALMKEMEEQLKYKQVERELEMAGKIQSGILPDGDHLLPNLPQIEAFARMKQAREVGGDFFDIIALEDGHVYVAIGDVSGKGMPAALFMIRIFTSLRMLLSSASHFAEVIPAVNRILVRNNPDMMFVSLFAGVLNLRTGSFRYVNAGQHPPLLARKGEDYRPLGGGKGTLVGVLEEAKYQVDQVLLAPGDALLLYTDGITEAMNTEGRMFGVKRARQALDRVADDTISEQVGALEDALEAFVGSADQYDDYTVLAFRYLGQEV